MGMIDDIKEFHEKFGLDYHGPPRQLSDEVYKFRSDFMAEELEEYDSAYEDDDLELCFDSIIDLVYVAFGTAYLHGFDFEKGWARVHAANMTKIRVLSSQASNTKRKSIYDVVKPEGWTPPDLSDLVDTLTCSFCNTMGEAFLLCTKCNKKVCDNCVTDEELGSGITIKVCGACLELDPEVE